MIFQPLMAEHVYDLRAWAKEFEISPEYAVEMEEGGGWSAIDDGKAIACGGLLYLRPGVGWAWTLLARPWRKHARKITGKCAEAIDSSPFRRIEAVAHADNPNAGKWLTRLGFSLEAERMKDWATDGDYALYAKVR